MEWFHWCYGLTQKCLCLSLIWYVIDERLSFILASLDMWLEYWLSHLSEQVVKMTSRGHFKGQSGHCSEDRTLIESIQGGCCCNGMQDPGNACFSLEFLSTRNSAFWFLLCVRVCKGVHRRGMGCYCYVCFVQHQFLNQERYINNIYILFMNVRLDLVNSKPVAIYFNVMCFWVYLGQHP